MANQDVLVTLNESRRLSLAQYQRLAAVPPEAQWFANLDSAQTRRAYQNDLKAFMAFTGIVQPQEFRSVTRGHVLAWRADLEKQNLAGATIRRKLAALASLYDYLCEANAVTHNPVRGVKRPKAETSEGKTPALGDAQARALLDAPPADTLKGKRDRAILSVLLYHALRREELTKLLVKDFDQDRRGVPHLAVQGKGGKLRYLPAHPHSLRLVAEYLAASGHGGEADAPLFRRIRSPKTGALASALTPGAVYSEVVVHYMKQVGIAGENMGPHALRATAATSARWSTRPTSPKSRSGWATRASAQRESMTGAAPGPRIRPLSKLLTAERVAFEWAELSLSWVNYGNVFSLHSSFAAKASTDQRLLHGTSVLNSGIHVSRHSRHSSSGSKVPIADAQILNSTGSI